jgi:hypothetical protein
MLEGLTQAAQSKNARVDRLRRIGLDRLKDQNVDLRLQLLNTASLMSNGVEIVPVESPTDFPAGFPATDLANYQSIVSAFAHCFQPALFQPLGIADPYGAWPYHVAYWDDLFASLRPGGFPVHVGKAAPGSACFGVDGETDGRSYMFIYDCTPEADVFHEIGHVVHHSGIFGGFQPLYYHYTTRNGNVIDARDEFNRLFGQRNYANKPVDKLDGVPFGYVTTYALTDDGEDFADTFKYIVYLPDDIWQKAERQRQQGDTLLEDKAIYVSNLFSNMWFEQGGKVGGWLGYKID